ncbi:MAG: LamG-like jellyroll fold domain-containing protein, partial [Deltaproteobacteria bacterium]
FLIGDGETSDSIIAPKPTTGWHHVSATYTGTELALYIDGTEVSRKETTIQPKSNDEALTIGHARARDANGGFYSSGQFSGSLARLKIIKKSFTPQDAKEHYQKELLERGLVAYWPFDGQEKESVKNIKSTPNGTVQYGTGVSGQALKTTMGGFIEVPHTDDLHLSKSPTGGTISAWYKEEGSSDTFSAIVAKGSDGADRPKNEYYLGVFDSTLTEQSNPLEWNRTGNSWNNILSQVYTEGIGVINLAQARKDTLNIPKQQWHHAVMTWNYQQLSVYIDGKKLQTTTLNEPLHIPDNTPLTIGAFLTPTSRLGLSTTRRFNGSIDEVRLYNRTVSPQEVSLLYQQYSGNAKGIVHYSFDNTLADSLGRQPTATVYGPAPTFKKGISDNVITFDKPNQSVDTGIILQNTSQLTIELWAKANDIPTVTKYGATMLSATDTTGMALRLLNKEGVPTLDADYRLTAPVTPSNLKGEQGGNNYYTLPSYVTTGSWNHYAVVFNGSRQSVYINGELLGQRTISATPEQIRFNNVTPLWIGNEPQYYSDRTPTVQHQNSTDATHPAGVDSFPFNGSIDELSITYAEKTSAQIKSAFRKGYVAHYRELNSYYTNQGNGDYAAGVLLSDGAVLGLKPGTPITNDPTKGYAFKELLGVILDQPIGPWTLPLKAYYETATTNYVHSALPDEQKTIEQGTREELIGLIGYVANTSTFSSDSLTPLYRVRTAFPDSDEPFTNDSKDHKLITSEEDLTQPFKPAPTLYQQGYILDAAKTGIPFSNAWWTFDNTSTSKEPRTRYTYQSVQQPADGMLRDGIAISAWETELSLKADLTTGNV